MSGFSISKAKKEHMTTPCKYSVGHRMSRAPASNQNALYLSALYMSLGSHRAPGLENESQINPECYTSQ